MTTSPLNSTSIDQMELLCPKLLNHKGIIRIIKTLKTEDTGRWLVETTKKLEKQARAHFNSKPNRTLTSRGVDEISQLITNTKIQNPDEEKGKPTKNSWKKTTRINKTQAPDTYDQIPVIDNKIQNTEPNPPREIQQSKGTSIDGQSLLNEIKSMKNEIISHC